MSLGGGGGDQDVTQTNEPWEAQREPLRYLYDEARSLYSDGGPQYYPNDTYIPFSPQSNAALQGTEASVYGGNPINDAAQQNVYDTLSGSYLNDNPYLDATYEKAMRGIMPGINATFGGGNRTGSYSHSNAVGSAAADLATNVYGDNYQQERDRQQQALAFAPSIGGLHYDELNRLGNVGQAYEGKAGEVLSDDINRYNYYQNLPEENLQRYSQFISPGQGFGTSTTEGVGGNPLTGAIGGGIAGLGLQSAPFFGAGAAGAAFAPYLPFIGAGLGLLS